MHYYQRWAENDRARLKAGPRTASCIFHTAQLAKAFDRELALLPALAQNDRAQLKAGSPTASCVILLTCASGGRSETLQPPFVTSHILEAVVWLGARGCKVCANGVSGARGWGGRAQALCTMRDFQEKMLEKLSEMTMTPTSQLRFLLDAWLQARPQRRTPRLRVRFRFQTSRRRCWRS